MLLSVAAIEQRHFSSGESYTVDKASSHFTKLLARRRIEEQNIGRRSLAAMYLMYYDTEDGTRTYTLQVCCT